MNLKHSDREDQMRRDDQLRENLLIALREQHQPLTELLEKVSGHGGYENGVYRFYHQSCKVFGWQCYTKEMVAALQGLLPGRALNCWFVQIVSEGTGKKFALEMNDDWLPHTRPIVEAFFHARFMLEMAVKYADLTEVPQMMRSGWAALLYLYDLR